MYGLEGKYMREDDPNTLIGTAIILGQHEHVVDPEVGTGRGDSPSPAYSDGHRKKNWPLGRRRRRGIWTPIPKERIPVLHREPDRKSIRP